MATPLEESFEEMFSRLQYLTPVRQQRLSVAHGMDVGVQPQWIFMDAEGTEQDLAARALAEAIGLHPIAARVLVARGMATPEAGLAFLANGFESLPDPRLLKDMAKAVDRIIAAVEKNECVALYGDYDVDGVSSTALLKTFLEALGLSVAPYIPHRLHEGYGLNVEAIESLAARGMKLVITLDCGITSIAEIARANELGVDVLVVDHHATSTELPAALAVINPHQQGCDYPSKDLCAAGVTFNVCLALRRRLREMGFFDSRPEPNLKRMLDLVALATVSDVVPLLGSNRIFVHQGLKEIAQSSRPGLRALMSIAGIDGSVTASHIGFRLGPRINAAGRLDDASLGLQCLLARDQSEGSRLAAALDDANRERQQVEGSILEEALAMGEAAIARGARGLALSQPHWHPGVVGIVASRLVERFHRPAVLIGVHDGVGKGSARAIPGFDMLEAIRACSNWLGRYGGHRAAAGLSIAPEAIPGFCADFEAYAGTAVSDDALVPKLKIDTSVELKDLDLDLGLALERLGPFGQGNPEPTLAVRGAHVEGRVLPSTRMGQAGHLKLKVRGAPALDVIYFGGADALETIAGPVDLAFRASNDEFRGQRRLSLRVRALRASPLGSSSDSADA